MPITPQFTLSQTDSHIQVDIRVPHVRVSTETVQVVVSDDSVLHFSSPPYLLLLDFSPNSFHETAHESCAEYLPAIQNGTIRLTLQKQHKGHWENLDLLGKLLPKRTDKTSRWLREVIEDTPNDSADTTEALHESTSQTSSIKSDVNQLIGYGFLRMFSGIFTDLARDGLAKEMLEMPWHEDDLQDKAEIVYQNRRKQRIKVENDKFSAERYAQDLQVEDDYIYQCAMAMEPHWNQPSVDSLTDQLPSLAVSKSKTDSFFSSEERNQLMSIPYPLLPQSIAKQQRDSLLLGLLDILFVYSYDHLTTDGDPTVESAWTISILSASLSWLEDWHGDDLTTVSVVQSSIRRALIYPYLRNLDFCLDIWKQVTKILRQGVRCVLRCLLQTRAILDRSELYYLGNKLFLDPYLAWIQSDASSLQPIFDTLADQVQLALADERLKEKLNLGLVQIEEGDWYYSEEESESAIVSDNSSDSSDYTTSKSDSSDTGETEASLEHDESSKSRSSELLDVNLELNLSALRLSVSNKEGDEARVQLGRSKGQKSPLIRELD